MTRTHDPSLAYQRMIVLLLMVMCALNYADRAVISASMPLISKEYHLSAGAVGVLLSASSWAYILLNFPSALMLDHFGTRVTGTLSVFLWSLAMILGAVAPNYSILFFSRIMLGAGEAPTFPLGSKIINGDISRHWRPLAFTLFMSSMQFGLFAGTAITGILAASHGWRFTLVAFGGAGIVWSALWCIATARQTTGESRPSMVRPERIDIRRLVRAPTFVGFVVCACASNYTNFLLASWLPLYMHDALGLNIKNSGLYSGACYLMAGCISLLATALLQRSVTSPRHAITTSCRIVAIGFLLSAGLMFLLMFERTIPTIVLTLSATLGTLRTISSFYQTALADSLKEKSRIGSVYGVSLTFSNFSGLLAPIITGFILQYTASFQSAFLLSSITLLSGSLAAVFLLGKGPFSIGPEAFTSTDKTLAA